jgi:hypothetical protein
MLPPVPRAHRPRAAASALLAAAIGCGSCGSPPPPHPVPAAGSASPAALRVLSDRLDGRALLAPEAARAQAAGAGPLQVLGADVASEGDRLGAFVEIPEGECLFAFTRASPTIIDVDLFAYDDDGSAFATDESPEPESAVLVCPPHPRRLYVVARVMAGSGVLAVGVQSVPRSAEAAVARAAGARGRPGEDTGRLDAWPGLEGKIRAHRQAIGGRWDDVRRVVVPLSPRAPTRIGASVEAGRCLDVLVSPSEEVSSFELVVEDPSARIIGRGREHGRDRSIVLCSAVAAEVSIAVRPRASQGVAAITVGRSSPGAAPELGEGARVLYLTEPRDLDTAARALDRRLAPRGYDAAKTIGAGTARVGSRATASMDLPAGCARVDVIAGKPLAVVTAALWDDKGALVAESRGGAGAALFACGKGGKARLDLEALESPGPFSIELRKDRAAPPLLVAHPTAAARLLARVESGGESADASAAAAATLVPLEAGALKTFPLAVPARSCVEVIAALDTGGSGVDLRLVEAPGGEGAITRSRAVAGDRLCAGATALAGSFELRLGAGKADALVLTRAVTP